VLCTLSGAALIKSWLRDAPLASEARSLPERSGESVSTLDGAFQARASTFPIVVIDEAAQATELATLIPLQYGCERCVLAGDPQQLPATASRLDRSPA
jgi:superfamily I DNA and/or RNA helicase